MNVTIGKIIGKGSDGSTSSLGQSYYDVECVISQRGKKIRVGISADWGSNQGYRESHGNTAVSAWANTIEEAMKIAIGKSVTAEIDQKRVVEATSEAMDEAEGA